MRLPEEYRCCNEYGGEDIERVIGRAPVGKTLRYLLKAIREWGAANDPYNEYVDYMPEDDRLNAAFLVDYWNMAEAAGWDLEQPGGPLAQQPVRRPRTGHDCGKGCEDKRAGT